MTSISTSQPLQGERYYYGTGKRKTAIAQVRLYPGGDSSTINGKPFQEVFSWIAWQTRAMEPFRVSDTLGKFSVVARIHGGGISAWADALRHGITRALLAYDENLKPQLRSYGMVTRDPRIKEMKKYGLRGARRAKQYTKR